MFASSAYPIKNAGGYGTKRPKSSLAETTPYRDFFSTIITFREEDNMREIGHGSLTKVPYSGL